MARPGSSRRSKGDGGGGGNQWMTTYADAITVLMAFFVILYSMSETDAVKFRSFVRGLGAPFGNEVGLGLMPEHTGLQPELELPPPATPGEADSGMLPTPGGDIITDQGDTRDQLDVVSDAIGEALAEHDLEEIVERRREERGLVVSIGSDDILFALGSTQIDPLGRQAIAILARTLEPFPNALIVEGHTDDVPLNRAGYTNWNLSTDRAVAVLSLMIEDHGLPPERVAAVGYGEYHPLDTNDTASGRARNRRVDIVVLNNERGGS